MICINDDKMIFIYGSFCGYEHSLMCEGPGTKLKTHDSIPLNLCKQKCDDVVNQ